MHDIKVQKCTSPLERLSRFVNDPKYPSVGPHLRLLGFVGLWDHGNKLIKTYFKKLLFLITVSFFCSQYIRCILLFNTGSLKLILLYAPFHLGIVKSCFFRYDYKIWKEILTFTATVEIQQLSKKDYEINEIIHEYINRNRRVTYFFWALALFSNFSIFSEPYQKNQIYENGTGVYMYMFDGYTPFDNVPPGYYYSMVIQTVLGYLVSAYIVGWDTLVVSVMIFFVGQLKVSQLYCSRMITKKSSESHQNISECHKFHTSLIK